MTQEPALSPDAHAVLGPPPERFAPERHGGTLLAAEHLVRYWWAAHAAPGVDVLDAACGAGYGTAMLAAAGARSTIGVDLAPEAVAAARAACGDGVDIREGDLAALPLGDDSVDLAVCFETIEHVPHPARALAELRRVLRPEGTLLVSSPNRLVSPGRNPHHVMELAPAELEAELEAAGFPAVELRAQHSWLASALGPAPGASGELVGALASPEPAAGTEIYTVALAGDGSPPAALARGGTALADPGAPERMATGVRAIQRGSYVEAMRTFAEVEALRADLRAARAALAKLQRSPSWRVTAPLRAAKRALGRGR